MQQQDIAIPTLPSRCLANTIEFYRRLGFDGRMAGEAYAIVTRGNIEIHFFLHKELNPAESSAGCYIRLVKVQTSYEAFSLVQLPTQGIPRMDKLETKPWGMREFAIVDTDGNLLRIGQVI